MYALFSMENDYNQPSNNLEALFPKQPSIEELAHVLKFEFPSGNDDVTVKIVKIWSGKEMDINHTSYRLEKISSNWRAS